MLTVPLLLVPVAAALVAGLLGWAVAWPVARSRAHALFQTFVDLHAALRPFIEDGADGAEPVRLETDRGAPETCAWELGCGAPRLLAMAVPAGWTAVGLDAHLRLTEEFPHGTEGFTTGRLAGRGLRLHGAVLVFLGVRNSRLAFTAVRRRGWSRHDLEVLERCAAFLQQGLAESVAKHRRKLRERLVEEGPGLSGTARAAAVAAYLLGHELGNVGVAILRNDRGLLKPLAVSGRIGTGLMQTAGGALPAGIGVTGLVYRDGQDRYIDDYPAHPSAAPVLVGAGLASLAVVPLEQVPGCRTVVVVFSDQLRAWSEHDRGTLQDLRSAIRVVLRLQDAENRLKTMLDLERELIALDPSDMPGRLLEAAVALVPGAEAGSLLVRDGEAFRYVASHGYDLTLLTPHVLSEADVLDWYAADAAGYRTGTPRVRRGGVERITRMTILTAEEERTGPPGLDAIQANLCIPITDQGVVVAMLNLDAIQDEDAFGDEALAIALGFQPLTGFVLREVERVRLLTQQAITDSLTGLPNRRAFEEQLKHVQASAERRGEKFALFLMDLRGFKVINDTYGHQTGDVALRLVADALNTSARAVDTVFRWAGDEFAAILEDTDAGGAAVVAERMAFEVASLDFQGDGLAVDIGCAVFPDDGEDPQRLIDLADERMYEAKAAHARRPAT